jgi:hypothetical protein
METIKTEALPPPPGVIKSITAGFETIAAHVTTILLPMALDLFLWLGPRLSLEKLFLAIQPEVVGFWRAGGVSAEDIQRISDWYAVSLPKVNLFWLLRTIPVGISSVNFGRDMAQTPFGAPTILQVASDGNLLSWMLSLTVIGWICGGLYFRYVAWLATAKDPSEPIQAGRAIGQTILLSVFWFGIVMAIGLPTFLVLSVLAQLNSIIAQIAILVFSFLSMWLIVPLFFWPHGVYVKQENVLISIVSSLRMTRFTLPSSSMFVLTIFLLSMGLNLLWSIPTETSWMMLVGIFGHAFVTTALLAASFIYYRDMNVWLQTVLERMKANSAVKQV